jgi:hypothetical protein
LPRVRPSNGCRGEPRWGELGANALHYGRDVSLQDGHRIGPRRVLRALGKVEARDIGAARAQRFRDALHAAIGHVAAGAVRANERSVRARRATIEDDVRYSLQWHLCRIPEARGCDCSRGDCAQAKSLAQGSNSYASADSALRAENSRIIETARSARRGG